MKTRSIKMRLWQPLLILAAAIFGQVFFTACDEYISPDKPDLKVDETLFVFGLEGGSKTLNISCDRDWFISKIDDTEAEPAEDDDQPHWVELSSMQGPAGKSQVVIKVQRGEEDRDALVANFQLRSSSEGAVIRVVQSGIPIVTTGELVARNDKSAILSANWIYADDILMQEIGIQYRVKGTEAFTNGTADEIVHGDYQVYLTGLSPFTRYEYRAYVITGTGKSYYGEIMEMFTLPAATEMSVADFRAILLQEAVVARLNVVVVSDESHGNTIPGYVAVVDKNKSSEPNNGLLLAIPEGEKFEYGDNLDIYVGDFVTGTLNKTRYIRVDQINISKTGTGASISPVSVTYDELGLYESMYVSVADVQLTRSFLNEVRYPTWNGEDHPNADTSYDFEFKGTENTVAVMVNKSADFAGEEVKRGSGTLKGIVASSGDIILPGQSSDLSGLTGNRFESLLVLTFMEVTTSGEFQVGVETTAKVNISYRNADIEEGEVITGPVSVEISGAAAGGLTAIEQSNITLTQASGSIQVQIKGIPELDGEVIFKVTGLEEYGITDQKATVTATVVSDVPSGNFAAQWIPTSSDNTNKGAATPLALTSNTHAGQITVSAMTGTGFTNGANFGSNWGGAGFNTQTLANPSVYAEFTLSTGNNVLSLYEIDACLRKDGPGYTLCTIQYRIGSGPYVTFTEIEEPTAGNVQENYQKNISGVEALQNIAAGTTITFRLIPTGSTTAAGRWCINGAGSNYGFILKGDVN